MTIQEQVNQLGWTVGARCRQARRMVDLTQKALAEKIDTAENTISNYEAGVTKRHNRSTLNRWALACGVTPEWLATGLDGPEREEEPEARPKGQKYMLLTSGQVVDMSPLASLAVAN